MGAMGSKKKGPASNSSKEGETERRVQANNRAFNDEFLYAGNRIKTSKYNLVTFIPKNLFEQFQRLANFYFLVLMILQLIPEISSLTPLTTILPLVIVLLMTAVKDAIDDWCLPWVSSVPPWTTAVPLVIVLGLTAIKDIVDDYQRHQSDNQVNNRLSLVVRDGQLVEEKWTNVKVALTLPWAEEERGKVQVGDIIKMENDNFVAADLLLLTTSEPHGLCYIETAELDGETNLKARQALTETDEQGEEGIIGFDGILTCEVPNNRLNSFEGKLSWRGEDFALDNDKILLRGCVLRNTKWCYGVVVFAGRDTKLMMNSGKTKFKRTSLDRFLNVLIIGIVIFLISMCLICTILCGIWEYTTGQHFQTFLPWDKITEGTQEHGKGAAICFIAFLVFFSYVILLNTVVPISLYVSVEIIRFVHSFFINWDKEMYHAPSDSAARARTTTLNEDSWSPILIAFLVFFSYVILLNTVVPISLYVSVEIIRFVHSFFINWDKEMYHAPSDSAARARTTTLNEELGQIQYIFSDKTGTLTQNIMTFNKCSIGGKLYGDVLDAQGQPVEVNEKTKKVDFSTNKWHTPKFTFYDPELLRDTKTQVEQVSMFWRIIALCHTVMPDTKDGKLEYQAQSPDEEALTIAARNFGYVFKSRTPKSITIEALGKEETYELLCILDFNNVRKRMSVLVRDSQKKLLLLCKGADTMVLDRIAPGNGEEKDICQGHLDKFAGEGLRTLCCASKDIDEAFFAQWTVKQKQASVAMVDRQEKLDHLYEEIEEGMTLVGATAIEDKLQDGVPRCIANLAAANIKIWVLTGDKQETAINIGYSCHLLTEDMAEVFVVDAHDADSVQAQLMDIKRQVDSATRAAAATQQMTELRVDEPSANDGLAPNGNVILSSNQHAGSSGNICESAGADPRLSGEGGFALVINGHSLTHALEPAMEHLFLDIGCQCRSVICCRVTPLQKAMVVDLVKRNKKAVTLSIGDGANDVSMIKTAHIGVGISGQEGMQAVLASDFSIAQFRFLERLLLVHGRWSYLRMSKFLKYFFYKNFAFTLAHFWYAFFCGYSAQTVYDPAFIACYNLFFTSMPVLALGIFDQDVNERYSLSFPKLYIPGQYNLYFNMRIFVYSVLHGIASSLILFFIPYGTLHDNIAPDGLDIGDYDTLAFTIFSSLVVVVTAQIALDTAYWTVFNHVVVWGSLFVFYFIALVYYEAIGYSLMKQHSYGTALRAMGTPHYWFCILLTTVLLLLPVLAVRFFWFDTHPTLSDRLRVRQNLRRLQKGVSELPLRPFSRGSARRRRASIRSGYAFAHQQGFGDLITKGLVWRAFGAAAATNSASNPAIPKLSPIRESPGASRPTSPDPASSTTVVRAPSATPRVEEVL